MLFNSPAFIFVYLPLVLLGFFALSRVFGAGTARNWLTFASLVFYGYWEPAYLVLLMASISFNFTVGARLAAAVGQQGRRKLLTAGIVGNVLLLGYYKYTNFFIANVNSLFGTSIATIEAVLPLGISFFTFLQIAYLVDCHRHRERERGYLDYTLFVTFFPHLIAGPIVHHKDLLAQLKNHLNARFESAKFGTGLFVFCVGLAKKILIADQLGLVADRGYAQIAPAGIVDAWLTSLCYTFQIYFDFSGYSDMAIGLALMVNIRLPDNFNSPYQAASIRDFWRRWHITLSTWLRDYVYLPLGGNRAGRARTLFNLFITFLVGGVWHGAGWTFLLWGVAHGAAIVVHRLWSTSGHALPRRLSWLITFLFVHLCWVLFRAADLATASAMLKAMAGFSGIGELTLELPMVVLLFGAALIAWLAPNTREIVCPGPPRSRIAFRGGMLASGFSALALFYAMVAHIQNTPSQFLYFNF